jgi:hypothetical protein
MVVGLLLSGSTKVHLSAIDFASISLMEDTAVLAAVFG